MKRGGGARAVIWLAAWLGVASCGRPGPAVGAEPIRIGVIVSLTGSLGSVGEHLLESARLAEREVLSAGGLLGGRPVEIVFADDRTDPTQAAVAARRLIEEEGVVAIVGSLSSSASLAVQEVTRPAGIPQVSCCSTSEALDSAQPAGDRLLFRTVPSDALQAEVLARHAAANCDSLAVVFVNDAYGQPLAEAIERRFLALSEMASDVSKYPYDAGLPNYTALVNSVAADAPDCVALVGFPDEGGFILRDWNALPSPPPVQWIGSDGLKDDGFPAKAGSAAIVDGVMGTAPINAPETAAYNDYAINFETTYASPPGIFGAHQYDAVMLVMLAIERAGTTDGLAIRDALYEVSEPPGLLTTPGRAVTGLQWIREGLDINYEGASGPVDFNELGNVVADYEIWRFDAASESFVRESIVRASEL